MGTHWKDILPIDPYIVKSNSLLQDADRQILTLLYQPLIGPIAFSLYMTMWGELEQHSIWAKTATHKHLMAMMQTNLHVIYEERAKLEGIGLLKTYLEESAEEKLFIYELQAPLRPVDFFEDGMLNVFLYNRIGKEKFQQLKKRYSHPAVSENAVNVTKPFSEVFSSVQPSEWKVSDDVFDSLAPDVGDEFLKIGKSQSITISKDTFDFDLFEAGLSDTLIPKQALTRSVKELIVKLSFLYGIDPMQMQKVVMSAIGEEDRIEPEALRKSASEWYQLERGQVLPNLVERTQPFHLRDSENANSEIDSLDQELIDQLNTISPRKLLKDISGGVEPTQSDLKLIEEVMLDQKLEPGVTNVLIYYVLLKTDMRLTRNYVLKIASHWARKQIKTVSSAMQLAIEENRKYLEWAEGRKKTGNTGKKTIREEKLPDWLKDNKKQEPSSSESAVISDNSEEEKRKMLEAFKGINGE
ncbi:replication initiation and membrane attachment family protein [Bacillus gobiensis]|uniref:replication initiation and membrane attachment family protein n=1 Tax=Bacillus gobiensis TaxID=1441095 RepID=UPI003D1ABF30